MGAEVFADTTRGVARQVQSVMQAPSAVVVPQMMVWVSPVDSDRKGCVAHYSCIINPKQSPASSATKPVAARNNLSVGSSSLFIFSPSSSNFSSSLGLSLVN